MTAIVKVDLELVFKDADRVPDKDELGEIEHDLETLLLIHGMMESKAHITKMVLE